MENFSHTSAVFLAAALAAAIPGSSMADSDVAGNCEASDLLIENTTIYTADDTRWTAEALAVRGERIAFLGSSAEAAAWRCGAEEIRDLSGSVVYPGFTDSHQHLEGVGRRTRTLSLFGIPTLAATVERIEAWAADVPEGEWVLGRGWIEREWSDERRFLTRHDVDPFTRGKPLYMPRADGVSALVNTKAMELAGVTSDTPDPEGGRFHRDAEGNLTGYVLATAMDRFRSILPSETDAYLKDNLLLGMQANAALGWTQTHDAGMPWRQVGLLRELHREERMAHRVYVAVPIQQAQVLFDHGPEVSDDRLLEVRGIKVFIDGTLGSRGAALLQPYSDADHRGFMNRTTKAQLMPVLATALEDGFQVMTHVIGDRALRSVLDWYDEAWAALPRSEWARTELRWRLEHAQLIPPVDQQRIAAMKVIPSMQPSHAIGDLNFAPIRLGRERLANAYPWQPLIDLGLIIPAGSDAPVEAGDPRIEFYAAVTRKRLDGTDGKGWHPEYAVSRADALRMLTLWPAIAAFQEEDRGTLGVGKYADLTVFDRDLMTVPAAEILEARAVLTMVGGRVTYAAMP